MKSPDAYEQIYSHFHWQVPAQFNIADVCMRRWAQASAAEGRSAIVEHLGGMSYQEYSYATLMREACRLSHLLVAQGVKRGDRVAVVLPQRFECAVAYMACFQMGVVAMPLTQLFGEEALAFRLNDSAAVAAIVDINTSANLVKIRAHCEALLLVVDIGNSIIDPAPWHGKDVAWRATGDYPFTFDCVSTSADEAALLIYTSGTTGNPKGALIPHRALLGNLTGFVASQNWFGFDPAHCSVTQADLPTGSDAIFWSPADWAWTGGLMDALLPTLYFGRPIVAYAGRFSPDTAFEILQTYCITHSFLFPTALKAMMKAYPKAGEHFALRLQGLMSAGEAVGDAVFAYAQAQLGVTVNEMFGQTEINYVVGNCARFYPAKSGSMGRAYPGHRVALIDETGQVCEPNEDGVTEGEIAVHRMDRQGQADPVFFLGYWNNAQATASKYASGVTEQGWCRTGDLALQDKDGYLWYRGRADDMFKAAGYRIGPSEIENCLIKHPAVANAAVVPKPDADRGAVIKAFVVLVEGVRASDALITELQQHVRGKLAPYEYPKDIEFIDQLPMTTTGKVQRRVLRLLETDKAALNTKQPLPKD